LHLPAKFLLIGATNPCPCGYYGDAEVDCRCSPGKLASYRQRLSGPLLDRIDLQLAVSRPSSQIILRPVAGMDSVTARAMVLSARAKQQQRQDGFNGDLTGHELQQVTQLQDAEQALMLDAAKRFTLSPRAMHKVLRVARTIADLNNTQNIDRAALLEALGYRDVSLLG